MEIRSDLAEAPQVVPAIRRMSEALDVTFLPLLQGVSCISASGPGARQDTLELAETPGAFDRKTRPVPV